MKFSSILILLVALSVWNGQVFGYEVWMGTHLSTKTMAETPSAWANTAAKLEGININRAPHDTDPASNANWQSMISRYTNADKKMSEIARVSVSKNPEVVNESAFTAIDALLSQSLQEARNYNFKLNYLMFYDEAGTYQGATYLYNWTVTEVRHIREWLDANGHADIELIYDVRNNSQANRDWALNPLVNHIMIEASTTSFLGNTNNQITFLEWFWGNAITKDKRLFLQIPRTQDSISQYAGTRRLALMLGGLLGYNETGIRSSRLVFQPVTYNDRYPYLPETLSNGVSYTNTLTSICLSLIEQRNLFEGRLDRLPNLADANSFNRTLSPAISGIADQVLDENTISPLVSFGISDPDSPTSALTLNAVSSNPGLIPASGIAFAGTGGNRTLRITPAPGQSGSSSIVLTVSDGFWTASSSFTVTVGTLVFSLPSDAGIKDDFTPTDQNSPTTLLGVGGSSPYVDRCTVYVFQLPDMGAVANPFKTSTFTFHVSGKDNVLGNNDLYGLGRRNSPTVLGSDYYGQSTTADSSDATRLQTAVLTDEIPLGLVTTSGAGSTALLNYLNARYESGAGIGKYVFLRLNTTAPKSGISRASLTMCEGGNALTTDTRPRILLTGNSAPTIGPLADISINAGSIVSAIPFTVGDAESLPAALTLTVVSENSALIPTGGINLGGSGVNRTLRLTPSMNQLGQSLITVTVSDGVRTASSVFTLIVTGNPIQTWRFTHFGTTSNSGLASDTADADSDSESNLLEFATGQDPKAATLASAPLKISGNALELIFTRGRAAKSFGVTSEVQWSDTLLPGSWSAGGVSEKILFENSDLQSVKATFAKGATGKRFARLHVALPAPP